MASREDRYEKIINIICEYKGINRDEIVKLLRDRDCKYLLFLLLKKYKCDDFEKLNKDFCIESKKSVNYSFRKAEEKFLINREFRELVFKAEDKVEKTV